MMPFIVGDNGNGTHGLLSTSAADVAISTGSRRPIGGLEPFHGGLLIHASRVISPVPKSKFALLGTCTEAAVPLKLNACPTLPGANVAPPRSVPLLPPLISFAFPSPGHQLTMPEG